MVKRKGGGKKKVLHLSEFLGDEALAAPKAAPIFNNECSTDLSVNREFQAKLFLVLNYSVVIFNSSSIVSNI